MQIVRKMVAIVLIAFIMISHSYTLVVATYEQIENQESISTKQVKEETQGEKLVSEKYEVSEEKNLITRVLPETPIDILKDNFNMSKSDIKIYQGENEIQEGYVATGMNLKYEGSSKTYIISVIGDLNADGKMGQIELNHLIKYTVGMNKQELKEEEQASMDINGDGKINQIDITILIRWIVYHRLEIPETKPQWPQINVSDIHINYSETNWTKNNVMVTIKIDEQVEMKNCKLQYSVDGGKTWTDYEEEVKLEIKENTNIIVRLTDGINNLEVATGKVANIDRKEPEASIKILETRTGKIVTKVQSQDDVSGIAKYIYYLGTKNEQGKIEYAKYKEEQINEIANKKIEKTYEYNGLEKGTTYYVKVEIIDQAGNKKELDKTVTTKSYVPNLNEQNTSIEISKKDEWTKEDVIVKVKLDGDIQDESFELEYSKDRETTWERYNEETGIIVKENSKIDIRLTDGSNVGEKITVEITNIDKTAPQVSLNSVTATSKAIDVEVEAKDNQSGIKSYIYYLGEQNEEGAVEYIKYQETNQARYQYTDLKQATTYYIKVEVIDNVGNIQTKTTTIQTATIESGESAVTLTQSIKTWTNQNVEITIHYKETPYKVEYSIDGNLWIPVNVNGQKVTIEENRVIYARLTDGQDVGEVVSLNIQNIDKTIPQIGSYENEAIYTDGFTIKLQTTDNLSGISNIIWNIKEKDDVYYTQEKEIYTVQEGLVAGKNEIEKQKTYTGLKQEMTYQVYAQIYDVAGNKIETPIEEITLTQVGDLNTENTTIYCNPTTWTNGRVSVTIQTADTQQQIEYSLDGENWYRYTNAIKMQENGNIYARLTDGVNVGESVTATISNIDTTKPTVSNIKLQSRTTKSIIAQITLQDEMSGIGKIEWYYKHSNESSYQKIEKNYQNLNGEQVGTTQQENKTVELSNISSGLYSIYAKIYDVAGNHIETPITLLETEKVPNSDEEPSFNIIQTPEHWTNENVNLVLESNSEKYNVEYSNNHTIWKQESHITIEKNSKIHVRLTDGVNHGETTTLVIGNIDKVKPDVSTIVAKNITSKGFTAQITVQDQLSGLGKIEWYYKKNTDTDYAKVTKEYQAINSMQAGETSKTEKELYLDNLEGGTYEVYAQIYDVAGNKQTTSISTIQTIPVPTGANNIVIIQKPTTWTNGNVMVILTSNMPDYILQYSTDNDTWITGTSTIVTNNTTIYTRLTDSVNVGQAKQLNIQNIDKTPPTIEELVIKNTTTKGFSVQLQITDILSGLGKVNWYYKKSTQTDYTKITKEYQTLNGNTKGETTTIKDLEINNIVGGTYQIYAQVYDVAGNSTVSKTIEVTTQAMSATGGTITLTQTPTYWTNQDVIVTVNADTSEYEVEYSTDSIIWVTGTSAQITTNSEVQARLTDGLNTGEIKNIKIENIDKVKPIVSSITSKDITTKSFKLSLTTNDNLSGLGKIEWYYKKQSDDEYTKIEKSYQTINGTQVGEIASQTKEVEINNLKSGIYNVYAKVYDVAGNMTITEIEDIETHYIPTSEDALTLTQTPTKWTNGDVTVTIDTNTTGFMIEYNIDDGTWQEGTSVSMVQNGTVNARLTDGINIGATKEIVIGNIDKIKPTVSNITAKDITTKNFKLSLTTSDNLSGLAKINWYYKKELDDEYIKIEQDYQTMNGTETGVTDSQTKEMKIENLQSGIYNVYAEVYDVVGNMTTTEIKDVETDYIPTSENALTLTQTPKEWTNGDVTVTIDTNTTDFTIEYSIDGGMWQEGTSVSMVQNGTVNARLTDGINIGATGSITVTNIDKILPEEATITLNLDKKEVYLDATISAQITHIDNQSGIAIDNCKWLYSTDENKIGIDSSEWNTASIFSINNQTISFVPTQIGTYYIHVLSVDNVGNKTESISSEVTVKESESNWEEIDKIAKAIAENDSITSDSTTATVTVEGASKTINVGDICKVEYDGQIRRARVLGFKYDDLVDATVYGGDHEKASISFEFLDFMTGDTYMSMNSEDDNTGGWAATQMRKDLNGYTTSDDNQSGAIGGLGANLSNSQYIKQVKKQYIKTYHDEKSVTTCNDYLWLLASSEMVATESDSTKYGLVITSEGSRYKYYEGVTEVYDSPSDGRKKYNASGSVDVWWLRSPSYNSSTNFCRVINDGACSYGERK